jgi:hypothetical protein
MTDDRFTAVPGVRQGIGETEHPVAGSRNEHHDGLLADNSFDPPSDEQLAPSIAQGKTSQRLISKSQLLKCVSNWL